MWCLNGTARLKSYNLCGRNTLKVFKVVFVGIGEASHGPIIVLLEEAHILSSRQQPFPGGTHQKQVRFVLLLSSDSMA